MTNDLFGAGGHNPQQPEGDTEQGYQPLAAKLRPHTLADYAGQAHILGPGKPLRQAIDSHQLHSMIFWGPPGVGKTTLARIAQGRQMPISYSCPRYSVE